MEREENYCVECDKIIPRHKHGYYCSRDCEKAYKQREKQYEADEALDNTQED
jgi:hypothetical protein